MVHILHFTTERDVLFWTTIHWRVCNDAKISRQDMICRISNKRRMLTYPLNKDVVRCLGGWTPHYPTVRLFLDTLSLNHKMNMFSGFLCPKTYILTFWLLLVIYCIFTKIGHNTYNGAHIKRHLEFPQELKEDKWGLLLYYKTHCSGPFLK